MWDLNASVGGALQRAEDACAGRRADEADVEVAAEGAWLAVYVLHEVLVTVHRRLALVDRVQLQFPQQLCGTEGAASPARTHNTAVASQTWAHATQHNEINFNAQSNSHKTSQKNEIGNTKLFTNHKCSEIEQLLQICCLQSCDKWWTVNCECCLCTTNGCASGLLVVTLQYCLTVD